MSTTTTSLRTPPAPDASSSPGTLAGGAGEPAVLQRERAVLAEIVRLVAERADAEAKVGEDRTSGSARADSEYQKTRRALIEKLQNLETEAITADEKRRRAIVDAALDGERKAKAEFAAASRKLATLFDSARDVAKNEYNDRPRTRPPATLIRVNEKPPKSTPKRPSRSKTVRRMADGYRERLAELAADYGKFKLNPEPPAPTRESYDRFSDPSDELFTRLARMEPPLKLLESLIIPKSMKGGREAWVFVFAIVPLVGIAWAMDLDVSTIGIAAGVGAALAVALRTWLVKLSQSQLESRYVPLMHTLADCRRPDRALPRLDRCGVQRRAQAHRGPPRRRAETRRGEVSQGVCRRRGAA